MVAQLSRIKSCKQKVSHTSVMAVCYTTGRYTSVALKSDIKMYMLVSYHYLAFNLSIYGYWVEDKTWPFVVGDYIKLVVI